MAEWIYFIHPPRENFAATMTEEEQAVWSVHFERFQRLLADGTIGWMHKDHLHIYEPSADDD